MSLNALALALQGFQFTPIAIAVQGFVELVATGGWSAVNTDTGQGIAPSNMKGYIERVNREYNRANRLALDDQAATEFIMALVHSEILYGAV